MSMLMNVATPSLIGKVTRYFSECAINDEISRLIIRDT
jgi:hypothetical protein